MDTLVGRQLAVKDEISRPPPATLAGLRCKAKLVLWRCAHDTVPLALARSLAADCERLSRER